MAPNRHLSRSMTPRVRAPLPLPITLVDEWEIDTSTFYSTSYTILTRAAGKKCALLYDFLEIYVTSI